MHPSMRVFASVAVLLTASLMAVPVAAVENPGADASANVPAASPAMQQLMRMAGFLSRLGQFSVALQSGYDVVQDSGQKIEFGERRELVLVRPNRLRVDIERSDGDV